MYLRMITHKHTYMHIIVMSSYVQKKTGSFCLFSGRPPDLHLPRQLPPQTPHQSPIHPWHQHLQQHSHGHRSLWPWLWQLVIHPRNRLHHHFEWLQLQHQLLEGQWQHGAQKFGQRHPHKGDHLPLWRCVWLCHGEVSFQSYFGRVWGGEEGWSELDLSAGYFFITTFGKKKKTNKECVCQFHKLN